MTAWTKRGWLALCAAALLLLNGCGGGTDPTKALVRLVNASGYDALTLSLDNSTVQSSVPYGSNSSYSEVDPKGTSATVTSPTSAAVLTTTTVALSKQNHYTLLSYGKTGALASVLLTDETGGPDSGKTLLRIINTAPDAGSLDVYLTADGDSIASSTALQSAVAYGSLGSYNTIVSGTWRLQVAAAGSKTDLRLNVGSLSFPSQGVMTLVLTPGKGGVLVNALLISQQGGITSAANTQARVRVVAGVTDSAAVSASVGGTSLVSGVAAPAQTNYTLLSAGSNLPVAVTAGSVSAALTSTTLAAGGDYTLMVYGTPAAPVAVLLSDDNTLPSDITGAKLRLVHGVADLSGALSLQVDFVVAASGVAQGAASSYTAVDASTTAQLTATGTGFTLNTGADQTFLASGVYSFFVVGSTTSSVPILHRDR